MEQMKNRKEHEAAEKFANGLADEFRAFWADEDGVGVIEVVLILVVHWSCDYFQDPDPETAGDHFQTD